jgi:hypothetical protein
MAAGRPELASKFKTPRFNFPTEAVNQAIEFCNFKALGT